jgi:hypothetical protein
MCFNSFSNQHVSRECPKPTCCLRCRKPGHFTQDCNRPRFLLGDKRGRRRSRVAARSCLPPKLTRKLFCPVGDLTLPATSCSTDGGVTPPPPTHPSALHHPALHWPAPPLQGRVRPPRFLLAHRNSGRRWSFVCSIAQRRLRMRSATSSLPWSQWWEGAALRFP